MEPDRHVNSSVNLNSDISGSVHSYYPRSLEETHLVTSIDFPDQFSNYFTHQIYRPLPKHPRPIRTYISSTAIEGIESLPNSQFFKNAINSHKCGKPVHFNINGKQKVLKGLKSKPGGCFRERLTGKSSAIDFAEHKGSHRDQPTGALETLNNAMRQLQIQQSKSKLVVPPIPIHQATALSPLKFRVDELQSQHFQKLLCWSFKNIKFQPPPAPTTYFQKLLEVSKAFGITIKQTTELSVFQERTNASGNPIWPDIYKFLGFACYQREEIDKAAYWLSMSHGYLVRADVLDKQLYYLSQDEELPQALMHKPEVIARHKFYRANFKRQMAFGLNPSIFQYQINQIDPSWNIIQLSSFPNVKNRFGQDFTKQETLPLFLTCFFTIPSLKKRVSFVTYIPKPRQELQEEFLKLMYGNQGINQYMHGDPAVYWKVRAHHNEELKKFVTKLEQEWIAPFGFLFPGGICDVDTSNLFWDCVEMLGHKYRLGYDKWIVIYKLIENYDMLGLDTQFQFTKFIQNLLGTPTVESAIIAQRIRNTVTLKSTKSITSRQRSPTILILDSEIEHYPWDSMECLKHTDVTRMISFCSIDAEYHLSRQRLAGYPAFVDPKKCSFVLNPDRTLLGVQKRLDDYLRSRIDWIGITGRFPTEHECKHVYEQQDILIYCGHGSGSRIISPYALSEVICRNVVILMGCSSIKPKLAMHSSLQRSTVTAYSTAGCPALVGFLWEVTDLECDRVTVELLENWLPGPSKPPEMPYFDSITKRKKTTSLTTAVRKSRLAASQYMTQAGIVCYGLPVFTRST